MKQECIPVGCISPTAVAFMGGLHTSPRAGTPQSSHPNQIPLNFPLGCGPGPDPPQLPLGCGPGDPPPPPSGQIPLNFPLGVGLETCKACWDNTPPMETCCKACWDTTCNACWDSTPPLWTDTPVKNNLHKLRCHGI